MGLKSVTTLAESRTESRCFGLEGLADDIQKVRPFIALPDDGKHAGGAGAFVHLGRWIGGMDDDREIGVAQHVAEPVKDRKTIAERVERCGVQGQVEDHEVRQLCVGRS